MADAPTVHFLFDGIEVVGREGEPIAAALLAAGFRVLRTMPESDDPRGGYCMVGRCSDCQVVVDGVAGVRSCVTPARTGMVVQTQLGVGRDDILELMDGAE
jgi:aerobic-type carbon monoxide dehydrogenase small subunit (CoxS/CutS family)